MTIGIFGRTDLRPVTYSLMKLLQALGDVAVVSANNHYTRLTEDGLCFGYFQNIAIFVTNVGYDEIYEEIEHVPEDFDYMIVENRYSDDLDFVIYVQGAGVDKLDEELLENLNNPFIIHLGFGSNKVPYTVNMFKALEEIEFYRMLKQVDSKLTGLLSKGLSEKLKLPASTVRKVVSK
jgi:hypothetical protein